MIKRLWDKYIMRSSSVMQQLIDARRSLMNGATAVNIQVNEQTAMKYSAVFASVRIIAETKASLPIDVYERQPGKDPEVRDHPVARLLQVEPGEDYTPMVWGEVRQAHLCLWGNSYTELEFEGRTAEIARAIPRMPWQVQPFRARDGRIYYRITDENGTRTLDRSQMLHVPAFSLNGIEGMSVIRHFIGESVGLGLAADKFVASFFNGGGKPSIVIEVPQMLDDQGYNRLRDGIEDQMSRPHKPLLLEHGAAAKNWTMPLGDAQLLESRKFQGEEVAARGFRLPPHVAGYLDNAKFNNIGAQDIYFEKHTMRPHLIRDEQHMNKTLFKPSERGRFYVKYNSDGILRGDIKTRYEAYRLALVAGWRTINEVRGLEDLEPLAGGEELPRPAAIWGKDDPAHIEEDPQPKEGQDDQRIDPRLQSLTTQAVRGLFHREAVALQRLANKPEELRSAIDSFYDKHAGIVAEKLGPLSRTQEPLMQIAEGHRREVLEVIERGGDLSESLTRCVSAWQANAGSVADQLLLNSYQSESIPESHQEDDDET
ncbi:phage portal protein [Rubinisphaera sp.]|uniref:phage portal protein n=1 Tax=Rubinisphaera sp. TaxID=2024857 RepID=UPI0025F788CE|nr:phage portal protein [Rubinisphaera sp.]